MCDLILVTVLKMRPHYSQSSREIDYEQSLFFFLVRRAKRPRFSRLAASPLNARARALPLLNLKKKDTARSLVVKMRTHPEAHPH